MLSALQHYLFCPRQCALIHLEQIWAENRYTVEGRVLHETADSGTGERRGDTLIVRSLPLRSFALGASGIADVVEFRRQEDGSERPFPVEYKRGRAKQGMADEVQLCAQALCLEEMLETDVPEGALFYGAQRRRKAVSFTDELRWKTQETARAVHELVASGRTPPPVGVPGCASCSLLETCMPASVGDSARVHAYIERVFGSS